jgi:TRAP-type C4-dicarboxylate transport system permease small subunit
MSLISGTAGAGVILFLAMVITTDVLGRSIGKSLLFTLELSGYCLIAISFLGLAYTHEKKRHIEITLLTSHLPQMVREKLKIVVLILSITFLGWFVWCLWGPLVIKYTTQAISTGSLSAPLWIPFCLIPVGYTTLAIMFINDLIQQIHVVRRGKPPDSIKTNH